MTAPPVTREQSAEVLGRFAVSGRLVSLEPHRGGHINDSWLACMAGSDGERRFLLQRINRHVFRRPDQVMENMVRVTRHLTERLSQEGVTDAARRVLQLLSARDGATHVVDQHGETWRLVAWVEGTRSTERARNADEAQATALAFGRFLRQLRGLPGPRLHETIPAFHDTEARLASFEKAVGEDRGGRAGACRPEIQAVLDRRALASALAEPARQGRLAERPVHNDAKIANVLFDAVSGEALCVVDLDTVMPGLAAHDFGDLARSTVSDSAEDERDLDRVAVRRPIYAALVHGFAQGAGDALTAAERSLLATGALVITYEQALRFLADHLDGDRYYRVARPGHNLERARAQLALLDSLERQRPALERL